MDCSRRKGRKVRGKNKDKEIVMVNLIQEKKKYQEQQQQKVQSAW
jgi:hypothetical protein